MSQQEGGAGRRCRKDTGKNTGNRNRTTRSVGQRKEGVKIG